MLQSIYNNFFMSTIVFLSSDCDDNKMAEHTKLVEQFLDVTGIEEERARFYLESAAWQLEVNLHKLLYVAEFIRHL